MLITTVSATLPVFLPSSDSSGIHRVAVYVGLYLAALGTGGIKACSSALGADQFDAADPVERVAKGSFFNWYYFSINIASLFSATVIVWVQDNIGWSVGFAIPTVLMGFGLAVFVAGGRIYRYKRTSGSPFTRVFQVVIVAARNYRLELPDDTSALYENDRAGHTSQLRFLDKAAIVIPSSEKKGPWRLCTVSQVEELKMLLRMAPIWASLLVFFAVTGQMSSTLVEQGVVMDNRVGAFTVPPAAMSTFNIATVLVCLPVYDAVLVPLTRRVTGEERGLTQLQRIGIGLTLSAAAMAYAASVEARRLVAEPAMSIMWLAPSYSLLGLAEVFTSIGMLEFFYDQSPESMKSLGSALAHLAIACGNYLNSALVGAVASATTGGGKPGWIPDNLDEGHLDYFFWFMAALSALNLLHFFYCSTRYHYGKVCF
jgi:peptide/histidine transporter 3/4